MRTALVLIATVLVLSPPIGHAQDGRAALESIASAMGAGGLKSIRYVGSGVNFHVGQNDTLLPLHGRMVPLAELHKAMGHHGH